jgi:DNA polymerase delta subunit 1
VHGERKPVVKNVMTLGSCAPIVGAEVISFSDERDMLRAWQAFLLATDPDWLIGYNIINFDFPYLIDRAAALGVVEFPFWGRVAGSRLRMKDTTFSSKAYGTRDSKEITIEGRVQFDLMQAIQRDHKLSSYSLNAVSAHFLGEQKEDVHHSAITELQNGNEETRRRLAVYWCAAGVLCGSVVLKPDSAFSLKDAYLPQRLLEKLMMTYNYIEMARVTGATLKPAGHLCLTIVDEQVCPFPSSSHVASPSRCCHRFCARRSSARCLCRTCRGWRVQTAMAWRTKAPLCWRRRLASTSSPSRLWTLRHCIHQS